MGLLAALTAASADPRSWSRRAAVASTVASLVLLVALYAWPLPAAWLAPAELGLKVGVLGAGLFVLARARRTDTRLIALLLAGAAVLPVFLSFWEPPA